MHGAQEGMLRAAGQGAHEQHAGNEAVEDSCQPQWDDVEDSKIQEVNGHVKASGDPVATDDLRPIREGELGRVHQEEPHEAIEGGEEPQRGDDAPGPGHGAQELRLDGVADGDVSLHREGSDGPGGDIDAQVLQIGDAEAAGVAVHPRSHHFGDVGQPGRQQHDEVGHSQAHQVAVGGGHHVLGAQHHQHHHGVARDAHATDEQHQQDGDHLQLQGLPGHPAQALAGAAQRYSRAGRAVLHRVCSHRRSPTHPAGAGAAPSALPAFPPTPAPPSPFFYDSPQVLKPPGSLHPSPRQTLRLEGQGAVRIPSTPGTVQDFP